MTSTKLFVVVATVMLAIDLLFMALATSSVWSLGPVALALLAIGWSGVVAFRHEPKVQMRIAQINVALSIVATCLLYFAQR